MSTSRIQLRGKTLRALVLSVVIAVIAAIGATTASANGGSNAPTLDWTQAAVYNSAAAAGTDRTWLGYVTSPTPIGPPIPNGTQTPSNGAFGDTVTPTSPRGANTAYKASFPAQSGSTSLGDATTAEGEFQFAGTVTWTAPGHNLNVSFENPRVVLNGDGTGALFAEGVSDVSSTATPYNDSTGPIFELDLNGRAPDGGAPASQPGFVSGYDAAQWKINFDGSITLTNIVPLVATPNTTSAIVFGPSYAAGVGPDRLPYRFGTFAINFPAASGPQGPEGPAGPAGPAGPQGPAGQDATVKTIVLKKAAFAKRSRLTAKLYKGGKHIGYAKVIGRKVTATFIGTELSGKYKLVEIGGKKRKATVTLG